MTPLFGLSLTWIGLLKQVVYSTCQVEIRKADSKYHSWLDSAFPWIVPLSFCLRILENAQLHAIINFKVLPRQVGNAYNPFTLLVRFVSTSPMLILRAYTCISQVVPTSFSLIRHAVLSRKGGAFRRRDHVDHKVLTLPGTQTSPIRLISSANLRLVICLVPTAVAWSGS